MGKCHACHLGAASAQGDWILFTDADCWLKPDVISRALQVAQREGADHVTLTPGIDAESFGAQAWHLAFLITLANWISGVNRDLPRAHLGIGAFNLVRASAYRECGGYEALRLTVLDDVRLGLLLRRAGKRTRGFIGGIDAQCHWGTTVRGMIQVMEKNYFAVMDFRLPVALATGISGILLWCVAAVGPFTGTAAGVAAGLAMLTLSFPANVFARRLGWGRTECTPDPVGFSHALLRDSELGVGDNSAGRRLLAKYVLFARRVTHGSGSVTGSMGLPRHPTWRVLQAVSRSALRQRIISGAATPQTTRSDSANTAIFYAACAAKPRFLKQREIGHQSCRMACIVDTDLRRGRLRRMGMQGNAKEGPTLTADRRV